MQVETLPLTNFVHGPIIAREGRALIIDRALAGDLERAGLVRIAPAPLAAPMAAPGKARDDGMGRPSSASHPALASSMLTSPLSRRGAIKRPKAAA